ncbi:hypothetical protein FPQ18DRAFT_308546 [Pyronema domesticum]|nr:hypothetical protein FPQ18DRAFT_308546 [Pyronema domesticum]
MFPSQPSNSDPRYAVWPSPYDQDQQPIYNNDQPVPWPAGGPYFNQPVQQDQNNMAQFPNQNRIQQLPPPFLNVMSNPMFQQNSRFSMTSPPAQFMNQQYDGFPITTHQTPTPFMNKPNSQFPTTPLTPIQQIYQQHSQFPITAPQTPVPFMNQQNSQFPITPQTPAQFMHQNNPLANAAGFPGQYTSQPNLHYFTPVPPDAPPAGQYMNQGVQQHPNTAQERWASAHNSTLRDIQDADNAQPTDSPSTPMSQHNWNLQTPQNNVPDMRLQQQPFSGEVLSGEVIKPRDEDNQNEVQVKKPAFKFSSAAKPFRPQNSRQRDPGASAVPIQPVQEKSMPNTQNPVSSMENQAPSSSFTAMTFVGQPTPPFTRPNSRQGPVNIQSEPVHEPPVYSQKNAPTPTANEGMPSSSVEPTLADQNTAPLTQTDVNSHQEPMKGLSERGNESPVSSQQSALSPTANEFTLSSSVVPTLADQTNPPLARANSREPENAPVLSVQEGSVSNHSHSRILEKKNVRKGWMGKPKNEGMPEQSRYVWHRLISEPKYVNEAPDHESQSLGSRSDPPSVLPSSQQPELSQNTKKAPSVINDTSHQFKSSRYFNNRKDTAESLEYANRRPSTIREYTAGELLSLLPFSTNASTHSDRLNSPSATHSPHLRLITKSLQSWDDLVISLADSLHRSDDFRTHNEAAMRDTTRNPIDAAAPTDKPVSHELPVNRIVKQSSSNGYPRIRRPKNFCNMTIPPPLTAYDQLDKHIIVQEQLYILCTCEARRRQHVLNKLLAIKETQAPQMADMLQQHSGELNHPIPTLRKTISHGTGVLRILQRMSAKYEVSQFLKNVTNRHTFCGIDVEDHVLQALKVYQKLGLHLPANIYIERYFFRMPSLIECLVDGDLAPTEGSEAEVHDVSEYIMYKTLTCKAGVAFCCADENLLSKVLTTLINMLLRSRDGVERLVTTASVAECWVEISDDTRAQDKLIHDFPDIEATLKKIVDGMKTQEDESASSSLFAVLQQLNARRSQLESWRSQVETPRSQVEAPRSQLEARRSQFEARRSQREAPRSEREAPRSQVEAPQSQLEALRSQVEAPRRHVGVRPRGADSANWRRVEQ